MGKRAVIAISLLIAAIYIGAIAFGAHTPGLLAMMDLSVGARTAARDWQPPRLGSIAFTPHSESIRYGADLFNHTPLYASKFTSSAISCTSCHAEGGIQPFASPMVGLPKTFPQWNDRAGHMITLKDRIQECFVRSENGRPLDYDGPEMKAFVDYITWLSQPEPGHKPFVGKGLVKLPTLTPDPVHGEQIYRAQCAGCHGDNGEGRPPLFPALWGPMSFNDGAGMNKVEKMAPFVQHNMPQNRMGSLTPQEAWDVSAFVHTRPRPAFNQAYKHF